ncbi:sulfatase [Halorhabdus amylolytica]|uniref:sulfatase n=1 Tax=Halorhabdus amylolytica TaxID=2559573 RepID=UPI0010AAD890|nr:sulfatase [Halorhabdus amylolytica]
MDPAGMNIVCIVADDLGWRDLGCYGSSFYETPNIDALARDGTLFTDAYAASPVCSPTRASLITGKYPTRAGITDWIDFRGETHPLRGKVIDTEYQTHLSSQETTLPEVLKEKNYETYHVGKWHLGGEGQKSLPGDHGFDVNIGGCEWGKPNGSNGYFAPWEIETLEESEEDGRYLPDRLSEEASNLIENSLDRNDPFFLHYNPYLVHTPIQAPDETVEKYEKKRQILGLDNVKEFEVGDRMPTEDKKHERIKRRKVQSNPTYAAMVEWLDRSVGRILNSIEKTGQLEDTIVVFTSDNGGLATAEGSPTTNRPLAEGKGWMEEGGNRVPLIIRWPGVTDQSVLASVQRTPVITPDLYPTLLDAANCSLPADQYIDGSDLRPLLSGKTIERDVIFWHYPHYGNQGGTPASAVRTGKWKLIEFFETNRIELYDLESDISETIDRSKDRPKKAEELTNRLHEWQEKVDAAIPERNPEFEPWPDRAAPDQ